MADDGETYMKARLRVFDITDEENITLLETVDASPGSLPTNDFSGVVAVDYFTDGVGFFFYSQQGGEPCLTTFNVMVSDDGGDAFSVPMVVSGPFPSARSDFTGGLGHYIEAADFSEPGVLLATWSEPVEITTAQTCMPCQGSQFSVATFGVRVRP